MPTQNQVAEHLDISQPQVSGLMERLGIDWRTASLDFIRVAYIQNLRAQASGHRAENGTDLVHERVLTERVDRELKQLMVNEKKGTLINVVQLEPELMQMVGAFRSELLSRDDKLKDELDTLYGIDTDLTILNDHTFAALSQLAQYDASGQGFDTSPGQSLPAAGENEHTGMGKELPEDVGQGIG